MMINVGNGKQVAFIYGMLWKNKLLFALASDHNFLFVWILSQKVKKKLLFYKKKLTYVKSKSDPV